MEILRPLNDAEIVELCELYKQKYGTHNFHYLLMYNQLKWNGQIAELTAVGDESKQWPGFYKTFYTHRDGDFRKHGTYVSLHYDVQQSVSFHTWQCDSSELYACLAATQLIDWRSGPLLTNVDLPHCAQVKEIAARAGVTIQRARLCTGLLLPRAQALTADVPSLPAAYIMRPLQAADAERVHALWTNQKEGSLAYVRGLIELNRTLGIYQRDNDALVAWILQNDFSGLGFLQVLDTVQRQGLGSILAVSLSKIIAEHEPVPIYAWIVVENFKSAGLLQKNGFEKDVNVEWIQFNKAI